MNLNVNLNTRKENEKEEDAYGLLAEELSVLLHRFDLETCKYAARSKYFVLIWVQRSIQPGWSCRNHPDCASDRSEALN